MFMTFAVMPVVGIETVIKEIGTKLNGQSSPNDDVVTSRKLQFEHSKAKEVIDSWKAHNLRAVNQDLAKQDVLRKLNGNNCLIVMDWAHGLGDEILTSPIQRANERLFRQEG